MESARAPPEPALESGDRAQSGVAAHNSVPALDSGVRGLESVTALEVRSCPRGRATMESGVGDVLSCRG